MVCEQKSYFKHYLNLFSCFYSIISIKLHNIYIDKFVKKNIILYQLTVPFKIFSKENMANLPVLLFYYDATNTFIKFDLGGLIG